MMLDGGKTKWWIMIFRDCTRWGSQPTPTVMIVDVITEAVDMIDVVFTYCIAFFDFSFYVEFVENLIYFLSRFDP